MGKCTPQLIHWLSKWEDELNGDIGHLLTHSQRQIVKIWVGNHIISRYEDILHDHNAPPVNDRPTKFDEPQIKKKKWYQF